MGRVHKIIVVALCSFLLVGCSGSKKPKGLEDELYEIALETIVIVDEYLDHTKTLDEMALIAENLIDDHIAYLSYMSDEELDILSSNVFANVTFLIVFFIANDNEDGKHDEEILRIRNDLAELINEKKK